jgi:hypothetical protein
MVKGSIIDKKITGSSDDTAKGVGFGSLHEIDTSKIQRYEFDD